MKVVAIVALVGVVVLCLFRSADLTPGFEAEMARVDHAAQSVLPTQSEMAWARSGWVTSMSGALEMARRLRRPVFVMCATGEVQKGRC